MCLQRIIECTLSLLIIILFSAVSPFYLYSEICFSQEAWDDFTADEIGISGMSVSIPNFSIRKPKFIGLLMKRDLLIITSIYWLSLPMG